MLIVRGTHVKASMSEVNKYTLSLKESDRAHILVG
jgi:hypothetical protein